jgi:hypothetical protein
MNWNAIGALGEIAGAIAVVLTLAYLARELRQNSRAVAITVSQSTTSNWNQWSEMLATSPDLADVVVKGNVSDSSLTEAESLRYGAFVQSFFDIAENYHILVLDHQVDKDIEVLEVIVSRRMTIAGFAHWWEHNSGDYSKEFCEWVEQLRKLSL